MMRRLSARRVAAGDCRSPILRLLQDCQLRADADGRIMVAVEFHQQWRTLWKAQRLGYLDADQYLTDAGRAFIEKESRS